MKQPSLRTKIFLSFGLIILIVMSVNTLMHIQEIKTDYLEALEWRSEALAQLISRDIKMIKKYTPTAMKNYPRLSEKLSWSCKQLFELNPKSNIAHCAVISSQGFILAHNRSASVDQQVSSELRSHIQRNNTVTVLDGDNYHTLIPIIEHVNEQDTFFGMVDIGIPKEVVTLKIKRLIKNSTGLLALFLFATFFCVSLILYVVVGRPLSKLMHVAKEIIRGNYSTRAQLTTHDEIGQTGRAFDTMTSTLVDTIQERDEHIEHINQLTLELEKHRDRLEQRTQQLQQELIERKRTEEDLRRTQFAVDHAGDAAFWVDPKAGILYVNNKASRLLRYSPQQLCSMTVHDIDPNFQKDIWNNHWEELRRSGSITFETRHKRKDGSTFPVEITANYAEIGGREYNFALARDITERKRAEQELEKHRDRLEEMVKERTAELEVANRSKSSFLANMSHELRTPLNVIMGYSQLMQKGVLSPTEQQENLATINRNGEYLLALINDVLEISRIEAGQFTVESTTFDLPAVFRDLEMAFASSMDTKGLFLEIMGIDDVPRYVTADKTKLRQVLFNLLSNGVKFTEQGGITVRVAAKDKTAGAMRLGVEVQDTGVGIAEDEMDKVFVYFEQSASGRAKKTGTGLGLAISRNYVRMMGGDISVTSKEGKGCTFRFEIDIKKGNEADLKARGSRQRVMGLQPGQKAPRVLVVEDESDSRALLVKLHETAGFEVEEAVNGKEAVEMFNKWQPDFVWMDIRMPVMDGLEATRHIKDTEAGQSTVVAALTAHALEEEKDKILAAGLDDFVRKPFREQEIFEVMAKHLGLKYVYEEKPVEPDAKVITEEEVTREQLAAVPADIRLMLHQAAVELSESKCLKVIEQIKVHDAEMAGALKTIVNQLDFYRLLDLLNAYGDQV